MRFFEICHNLPATGQPWVSMKSSVMALVAFLVLPGFLGPAIAEVVETIGHTPKLEDEAEARASIKELAPMVATLKDDSTLTLYEGLPHPMWDRELLESEKKEKKVIERYAFFFYERANALSEEDAKRLKAILRDGKTFVEFGGLKRCGGFHPDFALVWKDGDAEVELHVCFGCHELKAFRKDGEVYCDVAKEGYEELRKILGQYRIQRPAR